MQPYFSFPSSTEIFKRVVNLDCVISDETVGLALDALGLTKNCFRVPQPALPANERTEPPSVKFVGRGLHDISWRCG
jgi:hypothetical protein